MENMELWNKVEKSNSKQLKEVNNGARRFKAIDAYSQIKRATEEWGSFGKKWGVKNPVFTIHEGFVLYTATLFYPDGEFPIQSDTETVFRTGKRQGKYNEDWSKKISTDAITKGLSFLGFNADVFMGLWDDNKYVQAVKHEEAAANKATMEMIDELKKYRQGYQAANNDKAVKAIDEALQNGSYDKVQHMIEYIERKESGQ